MDRWLTIASIGLVMASAVIPRVSIDLAAIVGLGALVVFGVIGPTDAAHGFGNTTLLTVACMFVVAEALHRTGAADSITARVQKASQGGLRALLLTLLPVVMVLSGVMSNTGVVVLLLPALVAAAQKMNMSPSRLLLPLSYASITGGTLTLVGTTTTLLVHGMLQERAAKNPDLQFDVSGLGLLEILPMGLIFCAIALAYLVWFGPRLLPDRTALVTAITPGTTRQYMTEVTIREGSKMVGRTVEEIRARVEGIRVLQVVRGEESHWPPFSDLPLQPDDVLLVKGPPDELLELLQQKDVFGPGDVEESADLSGIDLALAEVMIVPGSSLEGVTVASAGMRNRFGVVVLAVLRRREHLRKAIGHVVLQVGDILLVQGSTGAVRRLSNHEMDMIRLGGTQPEAPNKDRAPLAIAVGVVALGTSAAGLVPLSIAVLLAAVALVIGGCLTAAQAYRSINLRIIVVLGCMLGIGLAVEETGLAGDIARWLVFDLSGDIQGDLRPYVVLALVYLGTLLVTELVTNVAAAAIMVPIALDAAGQMGVAERPFVYGIVLAASCSFLTPVGYQTNLLVYGPGGYRLQDYLRLGTPLSILLWIVGVLTLPLVFPF